MRFCRTKTCRATFRGQSRLLYNNKSSNRRRNEQKRELFWYEAKCGFTRLQTGDLSLVCVLVCGHVMASSFCDLDAKWSVVFDGLRWYIGKSSHFPASKASQQTEEPFCSCVAQGDDDPNIFRVLLISVTVARVVHQSKPKQLNANAPQY